MYAVGNHALMVKRAHARMHVCLHTCLLVRTYACMFVCLQVLRVHMHVFIDSCRRMS